MKKVHTSRGLVVVAILFALLVGLTLSQPASAQDRILSAKIEKLDFKVDKNGKEYGRAIISEERTLHGVKYSASVAVMAFSDHVGDLKKYKVGDTLKAVVAQREYKGRVSYTIMTFLGGAVAQR